MAGVKDSELDALGPFPAGIDNLSKETHLTSEKDARGKVHIIAARDIVNHDLNAEGWWQTRPGRTKLVDCASGHSMWRDGQFPLMLFVDSGTLYSWLPGNTPQALQAGLGPHELDYTLIGDRVYWSSIGARGCVLSSGDAVAWGVQTPAGQPTVTAGSGGGLDQGLYEVAITNRNAFGEESGAHAPVQVAVDANGSLVLSNIPQPTDSSVVFIRIYRSLTNGDQLYYARDIPVGTTSVTLTATRLGKPLETLFLDSPQPARWLTTLGGRILFARGNVLGWTEALRYGLTHPVKNRMRIGREIHMLAGIGDGTDGAGAFVADGKCVTWLAGANPFNWQPIRKLDIDVIPGSAKIVTGNVFGLPTTERVVYWVAANGQACIGMPGGTVQVLRETQAAAPYVGDAGASFFRRNGELRQIITALRGTSRNGLVIGDQVAARVFRNGVEIDG
jgi:hypothetical protein